MNATTIPLTIGGENRNVEVRDMWGDGKRLETTGLVGAYRKRSGGKLWADRVIFWRQDDGTYRANRTTTILNRAGYQLVGWADQITSGSASKHNSAAKTSHIYQPEQ